MNHKHKHDHDHQHHHHHHAEASNSDLQNSLTFRDKLIKRIEHWIGHNEEHAGNYLEWARRCGENEYQEASELLEETAKAAAGVNRKLEKIFAVIGVSAEKQSKS